jgi:hypothetical protein
MKGRGATLGADENSSPNVMQILLQGEAGSGEKVARRGPKKGSTPTKSPPKRMAPGVERTGNTPPTGVMEFSVPAQPKIVTGVLTEQGQAQAEAK